MKTVAKVEQIYFAPSTKLYAKFSGIQDECHVHRTCDLNNRDWLIKIGMAENLFDAVGQMLCQESIKGQEHLL